MLYTFHHIFSLPRGWLCCTLITSQGVMHIASTWAANGGLNGKPYKPLVVAPLSALFGCLSTLFYAHSKPTEINRAFAHFFFSFFFVVVAVCDQKNQKKKNKQKKLPNSLSSLSPSRLVSAPRTAPQSSHFMNKIWSVLRTMSLFRHTAWYPPSLLQHSHPNRLCIKQLRRKKRGTTSNCNTNGKVLLETGSYSRRGPYLESV